MEKIIVLWRPITFTIYYFPGWLPTFIGLVLLHPIDDLKEWLGILFIVVGCIILGGLRMRHTEISTHLDNLSRS